MGSTRTLGTSLFDCQYSGTDRDLHSEAGVHELVPNIGHHRKRIFGLHGGDDGDCNGDESRDRAGYCGNTPFYPDDPLQLLDPEAHQTSDSNHGPDQQPPESSPKQWGCDSCDLNRVLCVLFARIFVLSSFKLEFIVRS